MNAKVAGYSLEGPPPGGCALPCIRAFPLGTHAKHLGIGAEHITGTGLHPAPFPPHWCLRSGKRRRASWHWKGKRSFAQSPCQAMCPPLGFTGVPQRLDPPSPARDLPPTPGSGRELWTLLGPSLPEAALAAKEQVCQLAPQTPHQAVDSAKTPTPKGKLIIGPSYRSMEHPLPAIR